MTDIVAPRHESDIASQIFTWDNLNIKVRVEKLNNSGDCELFVYYNNGQDNRLLRHTTAHLLSTSHISTITKQLSKNVNIDWDTIFTYVTNLSLSKLREGEPIVELNGTLALTEPEYLMYPLFVKDAINTIYADRGSAKTLFVTLIDLMMSLPWVDNPLNFRVGDKPHKVLFLDWESNANITDWTASRLRRGMDIGYCPIYYRHCSLPLADDISQIKQKIAEIKADIIIVDSLGMAVGEDLNLTKPAFQYFSALRQLDPITSINIGHTAKNMELRRKTVYGNAYYENEARSIWEITKEQEIGSPELTITLYHRKPAPFAPVHSPLAYRFIFDGDTTRVELGDAKLDNRASNISDIEIVEATVADSDKPLQPKDIYNLTDHTINQTTIRSCCLRLKKGGKFRKTDEGYVYAVA